MELQFKQPNEISLPDCLASSDLTLSEIGVLVCFACLNNGGISAQNLFRKADMREPTDSLRDKGILKASMEGSKLTIELDLDNIQLMDESPAQEGAKQ